MGSVSARKMDLFRQHLVNRLGDESRLETMTPELQSVLQEFFDPAFYVTLYQDVKNSGMDPALHYYSYGFFEGRIPGPKIHTLSQMADKPGAPAAAPCSNAVATPAKPKLHRAGAYEAFYDMPLFVSWGLTDMCNYNCSYCWGYNKIDKNRFPSYKFYIKILEALKKLNRPAYDFTLSGGEPTVVPELPDLLYDIIQRFGSRLSHLNFITNASRSVEYFRDIAQIGKNNPMSVTISVHTDHANPEHILDVIRTLHESVHVNISLMFNYAKWDLTKKYYDLLRDLRREIDFDFGIGTIRGGNDQPSEKYTAEQLKWQKRSQEEFLEIAAKCQKTSSVPASMRYKLFWDGVHQETGDRWQKSVPIAHPTDTQRQELFVDGFFDFRDMYCIGGAHILAVYPNGGCATLRCNLKKVLGNLTNPEFSLSPEHFHIVKCPHNACGCGADDVVLKFSDRAEAETFLDFCRQKQRFLSQNRPQW